MKIFKYERVAHDEGSPMFIETEAASPIPGPSDLLIRVEAVSINPVDTKVRSGLVAVPDAVDVLGWDAAGKVIARGADVQLFGPGDDVFYAGTFTRAGANAELHLVDERMVGVKPSSLGFAEAAALPLTSLTAWQLLFDRFQIPTTKDFGSGSLLVIGGAGGVGSVLIQLARRLTGLTIIATASRPDIIAPQGKVGAIDDHDCLDVALLKAKSVSFHWEMVFTRPLFETKDLIRQHRILNEVSALVDAGVLRSTATRFVSPFSADSFTKGHQLVERGGGVGKVVVSRTTLPGTSALG